MCRLTVTGARPSLQTAETQNLNPTERVETTTNHTPRTTND